MLSDEEKKAIESLKNISIYMGDNYTFSQQGIRNLRENLRIVLPVIETQSKEIEELKEKKGVLQNELNKKIEALDKAMNNPDYISKDKIKAKIEEYKKQIAKMEKDDVGIGFTLGKEWSDLKAKIEFGQSLLEKE